MADIYCRGSTAGLIAELIKTEKLTRDEIHELQQLTKAKHSDTTLKKKVSKNS